MTKSGRALVAALVAATWLPVSVRAEEKCKQVFDEQEVRLARIEAAGGACDVVGDLLDQAVEFEKKNGFLCFSYYARGKKLRERLALITSRCAARNAVPVPPAEAPGPSGKPPAVSEPAAEPESPGPAAVPAETPPAAVPSEPPSQTPTPPPATPAPPVASPPPPPRSSTPPPATPAPPVAAPPITPAPTLVPPAARRTDSGAEADGDEPEATHQRKPGIYFGVGLRLSVAGAWEVEWKRREYDSWDEEWRSRKSDLSGELGTNPGFVIFLEYLTEGGYVAPGLAFSCNFISAAYAYYQTADMATELQFDPRLRVYLFKDSWWQPYLQLAAGFSFVVTTDSGERISDGVEDAFAMNMSGSLGVLFSPEESWVSFFVEAGMEGGFYWATASETDQDDYYGEYGEKSETDYKGSSRAMLLSAGLMF